MKNIFGSRSENNVTPEKPNDFASFVDACAAYNKQAAAVAATAAKNRKWKANK